MAFTAVSKLVLAGTLVGLLSGCASDLGRCLNMASQEAREIRRELEEARRAERFGYRIERIMAPEIVPAICMGPEEVPEHCDRWSYETQEIRHPINRARERERIALLEERLERAEAREARASEECRARYPDA